LESLGIDAKYANAGDVDRTRGPRGELLAAIDAAALRGDVDGASDLLARLLALSSEASHDGARGDE
jgi:hypothetical protein